MTRSQCLSFLCLFVCLGLLLGRPPAAAQEGRDLLFNARAYTPQPPPVPPIQRLGRFDGTGFVQLKERLPTPPERVYILLHGWAPGFREAVEESLRQGKFPLAWSLTDKQGRPYNDGWFQSLARSIRAVDPQAAILFFSWIDWSATRGSLDPGESQKHTDTAGQALAAAIRAALPGYDSRKIHFAGHSHGAKVATVAALDIHPAGLSLFDSPETGTMACRSGAANKLYHSAYLPKLRPDRTGQSTFVDSYYSYFGMCYNDLRPELKDIVDFKLSARPCWPWELGCQHGYPPRFYLLANGSNAKDLGIHWSPLRGAQYRTLAPDYRQTWTQASGNPLAYESRTKCFDSYQPCERPTSGAAEIHLGSRPLSVRVLTTLGTVISEVKSGITQSATVELREPGSAFWVAEFEKRPGDEVIQLDYQFRKPGEGDELGVWIDDVQELAVSGLWSGDAWRSTLVSVEHLPDGPHELVIALHSVGKPDADVQVKNLAMAGFAPR